MKYLDSNSAEKYFDSWPEIHNNKNCTDDDYKRDFLFISLKPKFKWFRPPLAIKILKWEISFSWAYEIENEYVLENAYPISFSSDFEYTRNVDNSEKLSKKGE